MFSVSREKTHFLHQISVDVPAETKGVLEINCKHQNLTALDPSVHMDKGLENHRMRTSASTPALVPLLAVLIAALPVPAHENFSASVGAVTSFSLSASKSDVRM